MIKTDLVSSRLIPKSAPRSLWIDYAHQDGVIITVTILDHWMHADIEQMAPNYASGWNSKYWQVYRALSTALCRRCKGGMLIGNLHCEPGHWQLPDRLVSTLLGWTSSTPHLRSLLPSTMAPLTIWLLSKEFIFEHIWHRLLSWTPQSTEIDCRTWVHLAF